jgi:hypothetical protein
LVTKGRKVSLAPRGQRARKAPSAYKVHKVFPVLRVETVRRVCKALSDQLDLKVRLDRRARTVLQE